MLRFRRFVALSRWLASFVPGADPSWVGSSFLGVPMPTPMPFSGFYEFAAGFSNAIAIDPFLPVVLVASAMAGIAFLAVRSLRKAVK